MMKNEFEALIGREISTDEYKVVETIYTWHPAISDTDGKREMAQIYALPEAIKSSVLKGMMAEANEVYLADTIRRNAKKIDSFRKKFTSGVSGVLSDLDESILELEGWLGQASCLWDDMSAGPRESMERKPFSAQENAEFERLEEKTDKAARICNALNEVKEKYGFDSF